MRIIKQFAIILTPLFMCLIISYGDAYAKWTVVGSPHDLSVSGSGGAHGKIVTDEERICVFCHAPHNATPATALWSRDLPTAQYIPYDSSTLQARPKPDRPTGSSRLCLSCHDGTIALNKYAGSKAGGSPVYMPTDPNPTMNPNLTTDLSDDHPISFPYSADLVSKSQMNNPAALPPEVKLDSDGMLQCASCHDPHSNEFGNFLVIDNKLPGSPLCVACHKNTGWSASEHNPPHGAGQTTGCMDCHYAHNAPAPQRLLHSKREEDNCINLACHNSGVSAVYANMQPVFGMPYRHPIELTSGVHDENETLPAGQTHVECVDCHNPHQSNRTNVPLSSPPAVNGPLLGVRGVNKDTLATVTAAAEYEICFKCHSGANAALFSGIISTPTNRMLMQPDQIKRFSQLKTSSFHPVTDQRRGTGASLLPQYQQTMLMIYCSDCHNSDQSARAGGVGPNGPHGSHYEHILMARYDMPQLPLASSPASDFTARYDLCFRCHVDTYIMGTSSGFVYNGTSEHLAHVQNRGIPCFACHDPHGVPISGATPIFSTHLINFARAYAAGAIVPNPSYTPQTNIGAGTCTVNCHTLGTNGGTTHSYPNQITLAPLLQRIKTK
jgi:predicted CXXCH cytochrome family protein